MTTSFETELPVICVTSPIIRSCLGSSRFACPASSLKPSTRRIFRAGFGPGSCFLRAWFAPFSSLVCAIFEPGSYYSRAWFVPFSSLDRAIFEPALYLFRACFVSFSSIGHARLRCGLLISFAAGLCKIST